MNRANVLWEVTLSLIAKLLASETSECHQTSCFFFLNVILSILKRSGLTSTVTAFFLQATHLLISFYWSSGLQNISSWQIQFLREKIARQRTFARETMKTDCESFTLREKVSHLWTFARFARKKLNTGRWFEFLSLKFRSRLKNSYLVTENSNFAYEIPISTRILRSHSCNSDLDPIFAISQDHQCELTRSWQKRQNQQMGLRPISIEIDNSLIK